MKTNFYLLVLNAFGIFFVFCLSSIGLSAQNVTIPITTENNALVLQTDNKNQLRTVYFGKLLSKTSDYATIAAQSKYDDDGRINYNSAFTPAGTWNVSEPAIQVKHSDENNSLELTYFSHKQEKINDNVSLTSVVLKDPVYPFQVTLFYKSWKKKILSNNGLKYFIPKKPGWYYKNMHRLICIFLIRNSI